MPYFEVLVRNQNSGLSTFIELGFTLSWTKNELKTAVFLRVRIYTVLGRNQTLTFLGLGFLLSWIRIELRTFLRVRVYSFLGGSQTQDH